MKYVYGTVIVFALITLPIIYYATWQDDSYNPPRPLDSIYRAYKAPAGSRIEDHPTGLFYVLPRVIFRDRDGNYHLERYSYCYHSPGTTRFCKVMKGPRGELILYLPCWCEPWIREFSEEDSVKTDLVIYLDEDQTEKVFPISKQQRYEKGTKGWICKNGEAIEVIVVENEDRSGRVTVDATKISLRLRVYVSQIMCRQEAERTAKQIIP